MCTNNIIEINTIHILVGITHSTISTWIYFILYIYIFFQIIKLLINKNTNL